MQNRLYLENTDAQLEQRVTKHRFLNTSEELLTIICKQSSWSSKLKHLIYLNPAFHKEYVGPSGVHALPLAGESLPLMSPNWLFRYLMLLLMRWQGAPSYHKHIIEESTDAEKAYPAVRPTYPGCHHSTVWSQEYLNILAVDTAIQLKVGLNTDQELMQLDLSQGEQPLEELEPPVQVSIPASWQTCKGGI